MSCFAQTSSGDLDISSGNLKLVTDQPTCTAQKLTNRFRLSLGEWFLDTRIGVPYYQYVLVKNPDLSSVGQLFKRVALQTPGVASVLAIALNFNSSGRSLSADIKAMDDTGAILQGGPGLPFIVQPNAKGTS